MRNALTTLFALFAAGYVNSKLFGDCDDFNIFQWILFVVTGIAMVLCIMNVFGEPRTEPPATEPESGDASREDR